MPVENDPFALTNSLQRKFINMADKCRLMHIFIRPLDVCRMSLNFTTVVYLPDLSSARLRSGRTSNVYQIDLSAEYFSNFGCLGKNPTQIKKIA